MESIATRPPTHPIRIVFMGAAGLHEADPQDGELTQQKEEPGRRAISGLFDSNGVALDRCRATRARARRACARTSSETHRGPRELRCAAPREPPVLRSVA